MGEEGLYYEILRALEIDHQYVARLNRDRTEQIALVRSLGRKPGRHFGWRVRTAPSRPIPRSEMTAKSTSSWRWSSRRPMNRDGLRNEASY